MFNFFFIKYVGLSHLFIFSYTYFLMTDIRKKKKRYLITFFLILFFALLIGEHYSNIDSLFLFMMYFLFGVYSSNEKRDFSPLMYTVTTYFIELIVSWITKPFFLQYLNASNNLIQSLFAMVIITGNLTIPYVLTVFFKKKLHLMNPHNKLILRLSIVCTILIFLYHTSWIIRNYNDSSFMNYLTILFYTFLFFFIYSVLNSEKKSAQLQFEIEKKETENQMMKMYEEEINRQYNEIRSFRHDYLNIVSSLEYYITEENISGMKQYFETCIKPTRTIFEINLTKLNNLENIDSVELRSIFLTKLCLAQNKGINNITIDIPKLIKIDPKINLSQLIRIFAIILDNAIEELEYLKKGKLIVTAYSTEGDSVIIIENSTRIDIAPLYILNSEGYSSKGSHRGLGLKNLSSLIENDPNLVLETQITNATFLQKVIISKEV